MALRAGSRRVRRELGCHREVDLGTVAAEAWGGERLIRGCVASRVRRVREHVLLEVEAQTRRAGRRLDGLLGLEERSAESAEGVSLLLVRRVRRHRGFPQTLVVRGQRRESAVEGVQDRGLGGMERLIQGVLVPVEGEGDRGPAWAKDFWMRLGPKPDAEEIRRIGLAASALLGSSTPVFGPCVVLNAPSPTSGAGRRIFRLEAISAGGGDLNRRIHRGLRGSGDGSRRHLLPAARGRLATAPARGACFHDMLVWGRMRGHLGQGEA